MTTRPPSGRPLAAPPLIPLQRSLPTVAGCPNCRQAVDVRSDFCEWCAYDLRAGQGRATRLPARPRAETISWPPRSETTAPSWHGRAMTWEDRAPKPVEPVPETAPTTDPPPTVPTQSEPTRTGLFRTGLFRTGAPRTQRNPTRPITPVRGRRRPGRPSGWWRRLAVGAGALAVIGLLGRDLQVQLHTRHELNRTRQALVVTQLHLIAATSQLQTGQLQTGQLQPAQQALLDSCRAAINTATTDVEAHQAQAAQAALQAAKTSCAQL
jgi:hypothetical protein